MANGEFNGKTADSDSVNPGSNPGCSATKPLETAASFSVYGVARIVPILPRDADIDFMKQMRTHHEAAIDMAKVVLANGKDVDTKKLAQEIIAAQEKEIAMIDAWLKKKGA